MSYRSLEDCLDDLEKHGHLVRVSEEVDPTWKWRPYIYVYTKQAGPPSCLKKVKGSRFRAARIFFGTLARERIHFPSITGKSAAAIALKTDPSRALKQPLRYAGAAWAATKAFPSGTHSVNRPVFRNQDFHLPLIRHWPMDGGAFVTLPQVYTEDIDKPGIMNANLGMYRIQPTATNTRPIKK